MIGVLKQALRPFDCLIFIAAVILFTSFDYDNLETVDIIYIVTFVIWFTLLLIRIVILYRNKGGKTH